MSQPTGSEVTDIPTDTLTECTEEYEEEAFEEEEEVIILYSEDFISNPFISEAGTIPEDILDFEFSFGYDCKRLFNMVPVDEFTLVFASGNLIHFYDVRSREMTFRRSYLGGGIGHITKNPNPEYSHLTVAENGDNPPIIIYEWPTMEIVGVLNGGAAKRYSHINYSPDGEMLVSQSYAPDFLITVWNWKKWRRSPIVLRTKSHVNDVYTVKFSPYVPGQITSGGNGHIKFWKMAQTFTGLKLQGELGRFGKTEITDILGVYPMPDEKVLSGTEWGNILVWEAGLIKLEVFRTLRRCCHNGPIMQIYYHRGKGEVWSISQDGWLRAWDYRMIDEADPPDDDRIVQMVPSYERETPGVQYMCVSKRRFHDPDDTFYYAQDGNGGIWLVDMILQGDHEESERLFRCHAGIVKDMAPCPWGIYIATLGEDGRLHIYNYKSKTLVFFHQFSAKGRTLMWLPLSIDTSGSFLLMGFDDGVLRMCVISLLDEDDVSITITQTSKPHCKPLTAMSLNPAGNLLVTAGEDLTMFIYNMKVQNGVVSLVPIGYVRLPSIITCFTWHPLLETIIYVGCTFGELLMYELPDQPVSYTLISYLLYTIEPVKQRFTTCKAQIRRDLHIADTVKRKAEKLEQKKANLAQVKAENPGVEIDEEIFLADSESEEVLEALHIPEIPNKIWFIQYTPENTLWLSMGGYDAGYIYEYTMDQTQEEPLKATIIADGDDIEMHSFIFSPDGKYLITSMQNGAIRLNRVNEEDFRDLKDYWQLSMHDNFNGQVTRMCFSYDQQYFFSCGTDGNIFSYHFNPEKKVAPIRRPSLMPSPYVNAIAIEDSYDSLSLEEIMLKAEDDKQLRLANEHKRKLRLRLKELTVRLTSLLERNCAMPKSQRYCLRQFIIDDRIMQALDDKLEAMVALERRKLAYDVEKSTIALAKLKYHYTDHLDKFPFTVKSIKSNLSVRTLPHRKLRKKFYESYETVHKKLEEEELRGKMPERILLQAKAQQGLVKMQLELEPFLVGLSPSTIAFKLGAKLNRLLAKYRQRRAIREKRKEEWTALNARKPPSGINHPDDIRALELAEKTVGDFKLKSAADYKVPKNARESTAKKYQQLLEARLSSHKLLLHAYNKKLSELRDGKVNMVERLQYLTKVLNRIHEELPEDRIREPPPIPELSVEDDFPEKKLDVIVNVEKEDRKKKKGKQAVGKSTVTEEEEFFDLEKDVIAVKGTLPAIPGDSTDIIKSVSKIKYMPEDELHYETLVQKVTDPKGVPWEKDMRAARLVRKLHEQNMIIQEMEGMIDDFDKKVKDLTDERLIIRTDATYMDLHLLVLNQELIIVKEFEAVENFYRANVQARTDEMLDMKDQMTHVENLIKEHQHGIDQGAIHMGEIGQTFINAAKDNKFWDFLRRIFKKKYKPPKILGPDESESSSSSESSSTEEEDDAASLDSRDIGPIRLDESICPKGCDKELYDYTFLLRGQRHELEKAAKEHQKSIENCRKELESCAKKMKILDSNVKKSENELLAFEREKQRTLNEVVCTVELHLDQMQHIDPNGNVSPLNECLVFDKKVLSQLYARVGELLGETLEERAKHKKNKLHLHRMNVDCRHMAETIKELQKEITETMKVQFGRIINIDELEESILRRMVQKLRFAMIDIKSCYERELKTLREQYAEKQVELKNTIQENTARLELLSVLNREKAELARILSFQTQRKEKLTQQVIVDFSQDINKLKAVSQNQVEQMQALRNEIKRLSTKSLPSKPISMSVPEKLEEEIRPNTPIEGALFDDLESLDEVYIPPDLELKPYVLMRDEIQQVTEEEIRSCVKDIIREVVRLRTSEDSSFEETIPKVVQDLVEQVPEEYLEQEESTNLIADLMSVAFENKVVDAALVQTHSSQTLDENVAEVAHKTVDSVAVLTEHIVSKIIEKRDKNQ